MLPSPYCCSVAALAASLAMKLTSWVTIWTARKMEWLCKIAIIVRCDCSFCRIQAFSTLNLQTFPWQSESRMLTLHARIFVLVCYPTSVVHHRCALRKMMPPMFKRATAEFPQCLEHLAINMLMCCLSLWVYKHGWSECEAMSITRKFSLGGLEVWGPCHL